MRVDQATSVWSGIPLAAGKLRSQGRRKLVHVSDGNVQLAEAEWKVSAV